MPTPLDYGGHTPAAPRPWLRRAGNWAITTAVVLGLAYVASSVLTPLHSHDWSPRAHCASNERQIGLAILLYQQDHAQHYPPALADLLAEEQIGPEVFTCPSSNDTPATYPSAPPGPTTRQIAAALAVPGHLSYLYFGHPDWTDKTVPADAIVLAEPPANHGNDGSNILFGDGHAEWVPQPRAARLIAAATASTRPVSAATVP